jgi:cell division protein FtsA
MEYVAVLDLGTSKMLAVAASKNNRQEILASEKVDLDNSIRRGLIYNPEKASAKLFSLINKFNFKLKPKLKKIYVGIGGQSLHTKAYSVRKEINGEIENETINSLLNECLNYPVAPLELIEIVSPEYYLDGHLELNPEGVKCNTIEAKFQLVLGRSSVKSDLEQLIKKTEIEIAEFFVSPIATAEAVLTNKEKDLGCALIEFGAGVTYLSIYKGGLLRYLVTIPLGGNAITKDICDLNITEQEAEEFKIKEGNVLVENEEDELNPIIEARVDEIIANILEQMKASGYEPALGAGLIITGGGSLLKNLDALLEQKTGKPVRKVEENPTQSCAFGLLKLGKENCAKEEIILNPPVSGETDMFGNPLSPKKQKEPKQPAPPKPPKKEGNFFTRLREKAGDVAEIAVKGLFDDDNTDQK